MLWLEGWRGFAEPPLKTWAIVWLEDLECDVMIPVLGSITTQASHQDSRCCRSTEQWIKTTTTWIYIEPSTPVGVSERFELEQDYTRLFCGISDTDPESFAKLIRSLNATIEINP